MLTDKEIPFPVPLGDGLFALVSEGDYERISSQNWMVYRNRMRTVCQVPAEEDVLGFGLMQPVEVVKRKKPRLYAVLDMGYLSKPSRPIFMHDSVIFRNKGEHVRFLDGNTLNNCRSNLITTSEYREMQEAKKQEFKERRITKYRGVQEIKYYKPSKWKATMDWAGDRTYLGMFDNPESAARAYDTLAVMLGRDRSVLNFPDEYPEHNPTPQRLKSVIGVPGGAGLRTRLLDRGNMVLLDGIEQLEEGRDNQGSPRHTPDDRPKRKRFVLRGSSNATLPPENDSGLDVEVVNDRLLDLMADFGL